MLRTWIRGRRGIAAGVASAAVVGLGGAAAVAFGGDGGPSKYVAVGAAGTSSAPGDSVAPTGKVEYVPLDSDAAGPSGSASGTGRGDGKGKSARSGAGAADGKGAGAEGDGSSGSGSGSGPDSGSGADSGSGEGAGSGSGGTGVDSPGTPSGSVSHAQPGSGGSASPAGPAALKVSEPVLKDADERWCQDVTLTLRNSGGSAVRSGTVTFETHIIGALGVDWATVESTEELPVPIGAGEKKEKTWKVCVDSWRVPLGMHVETRDVSVRWK
ncbi:hypothetical protein [Streptomyces sp. VRA16 Mangrove soil]|uniref:hypothetical protein n=1 Tax=Streptomyces sp. VRA16 Mangrove soil TaxID=2817434 RepID=UPI001A9F49A2|nr:hypothetical protein [Streptomyces sp. VRA16 Mangrove soil]MBO1336659.1 hypothetical protein [Streptomyces sp. VRA16 Mangrove soil]